MNIHALRVSVCAFGILLEQLVNFWDEILFIFLHIRRSLWHIRLLSQRMQIVLVFTWKLNGILNLSPESVFGSQKTLGANTPLEFPANPFFSMLLVNLPSLRFRGGDIPSVDRRR